MKLEDLGTKIDQAPISLKLFLFFFLCLVVLITIAGGMKGLLALLIFTAILGALVTFVYFVFEHG